MNTVHIDISEGTVYFVDVDYGPFVKTQYLTNLTDEQLARFKRVFDEFNAVQEELEALHNAHHRSIKP